MPGKYANYICPLFSNEGKSQKVYFIFKDLLIYLCETMTEAETFIFHLLGPSPNGSNSPCWARQKPGVRNAA